MRIRILACVIAILVLPQAAFAKAHQWKFTEVFSNADGSIQFIEMFVFDESGTQEWQLGNKLLQSNANTYVFPNNLPQVNTFHTWILIATPAFAALPGAPTPDYIMPANFFVLTGDQLRYRTQQDILPLPAGAVPTDGINSYFRDGTTGVNSPTNFAGETGSIDVSTPCSDGQDNDGDGEIDFGADPGCASANDPDQSERDSTDTWPCDDGEDDDGDGYADYPADPACQDASWSREDSQCQDGVNNDNQLGTDFDAGVSILGSGGANPQGADPQCLGLPWKNKERANSCGLGFELAAVLVGLRWLRRWRLPAGSRA